MKPQRSISLLAARIAAVPRALAEACAVALPDAPNPLERVIVTGIGGSEGPARMLVAALDDAPVDARFVPLSAFYLGLEPPADLLVLFSQGLSPNAQLALETTRARRRWIVTSVGYGGTKTTRREALAPLEQRGIVAITVPPGEERGLLARVIGPEVASLLALRLAAALGAEPLRGLRFEDAARAWRDPQRFAPLPRDVALLTDPRSQAWAFGLRWKLLEGLLLPDPPVWDALQLAHGPLQSFYERPMTLLALETPGTEELFDRVELLLVPRRHRTVRLRARRADPLAFFDHAADVDQLLLCTLEARPRDLFDWPARGADAALYALRRRRPSRH